MSPDRSRTSPFSPTRLLYLGLVLAFSAVLLYFSFRGLDWNGVLETLRSAKPERVALWLFIGTGSLFFRAARWRLLLSATRPVSYGTAFWATCAGYFGNSFLPARAGEIVRTMVVSVRTGLSAAYVLTTALSERIVDAITLVVISSLVLLFLPSRPGWFAGATNVFVPLGLGGALAIALIPRLEKLWRLLLKKLPVPERLRERVNTILDQVLAGAHALHNPLRLAGFLGLTGIIWLIDGIATVVGGWSLGVHIPLPLAFLLIAGLGLGSALPSTPGYVGIYQFVAVSVLTPFGIPKSDAIAYILLAQGLQYLSVSIWAYSRFQNWGVGSDGQARIRLLKPNLLKINLLEIAQVAIFNSDRLNNLSYKESYFALRRGETWLHARCATVISTSKKKRLMKAKH